MPLQHSLPMVNPEASDTGPSPLPERAEESAPVKAAVTPLPDAPSLVDLDHQTPGSEEFEDSGGWSAAGAWLAFTASLVLVALVIWQGRIPGQPVDFAEYRVDLLRELESSGGAMEGNESDLVPVREELAQRHAPSPRSLPDGLRRVQITGWRVLDWRGRPVSIVRFLARGQPVYLVTVRGSGFLGGPSGRSPAVAGLPPWATASWVDEGNLHSLVSTGTATELQELL